MPAESPHPLTSLEDNVAFTNRIINAQPGPVLLVGHSWGGSVITQAGGHDKVKALVHLAAFAPSLNMAPVADTSDFPAPPGVAHFITDADGYLTLPADAIARDFAQDLSAAEANLIHATQGAVRGTNFEQPVTVAAWTSKPSWYIVAADDRMILTRSVRWHRRLAPPQSNCRPATCRWRPIRKRWRR